MGGGGGVRRWFSRCLFVGYVLPIVWGALCLSLFWYALLFVPSSFAIILKRMRELVALLLLSYGIFCGSSLRCRGLVSSV